MASDFTFYRETPQLDVDRLRAIVIDLATDDTTFDQWDRVKVRNLVGELIDEGIGVVPADVTGADGYRQILALYLALLLRSGGARLDAIKREIASRDTNGLESLVRAVHQRTSTGSHRKAGTEPDGAPIEASEHGLDRTDKASMLDSGVTSRVKMPATGQTFRREGISSGTMALDNDALDYLRSLAPEDTSNTTMDGISSDGRPSTSPGPAGPGKVTKTSRSGSRAPGSEPTLSPWVRLEIGRDVELHLRIEALEAIKESVVRRNVVARIERALIDLADESSEKK